MKSYSSRDIIQILENDGWVLKAIKGSHHQYINPKTNQKATIPHPRKDLPVGTIKSIMKQTGITLK